MISILIAKTSDNRLIYANQFHWQKVFCPQCNKPVQFIEKSNTQYFKHINKNYNYNNESLVHKQGKIYLQNFFACGFDTKLEYVITTDQRIDLCAQNKKIKLAIEYQCSPISKKELRRRNDLYLKNNFDTVWIFGINHLKKSLKVKHLQSIVSYSKRWGFYCLFKIPHKKTLILHYNYQIHPANNRVYYSTYEFFDLKELIEFQPKNQMIINVVVNWQRWQIKKLKRPDQQYRQYQNYCYANRINLMNKVKETPLHTVSPIYSSLFCYQQVYKSIAKLPLIDPQVISKCVNREV